MMKSQELREQRHGLTVQARALFEKARSEDREPTSEETETFDKMMADVDRLGDEINKAERAEKLEHVEAELRQSAGRRVTPSKTRAEFNTVSDADRKEAFRAWCLAGTDRADHTAETRFKAEQVGINLNARNLSVRALSKGTNTAGGHTVPTNMVSQIEKQLAYWCPLRQWARVLTTDSGTVLDFPRTSDSSNTATIVGEGSSIGTSTDPTFDKVSVSSYKFATSIVLISLELLLDSAVNVEALLADLLAERMARGQNSYFFTGTGSSQPEGIVTAASVGANLASGSTMTSDKLIDLVHSVDLAYRTNGVFFAHDTTIAGIRKLKDGNNQYLWQPGLQAGQPDRLLGYPVIPCNNMATSGDNAKLVLFGDPKHFLIRDVGPSLSIGRLDELYAATGQIGYVMLQRTDSKMIGHSGCMKTLNAEDTA